MLAGVDGVLGSGDGGVASRFQIRDGRFLAAEGKGKKALLAQLGLDGRNFLLGYLRQSGDYRGRVLFERLAQRG